MEPRAQIFVKRAQEKDDDKKVYGPKMVAKVLDFWARFGAKPLGHNRKLTFSDFSYTEMVLELDADPNAITIDSDPYVIIRPEGEWDQPGVLDRSATREATMPRHDARSAA